MNLEYSLLNDQGKLLGFKLGEDKIPALNLLFKLFKMLKVKVFFQNPKNKNQDKGLTHLKNEIKNSIKSLYISDQKKKKTINKYAELLTKIRNEYAKLQKENNQLKIQLHKYQTYVQNMPRISCQKPSYQKPIRKRKRYYYIDPEESEKSHSYVTEIQRLPKKQRTRILYEDEIDGLPEYESDSPTDEEQEENNNYEIQTKHKEKQPKQIENQNNLRKVLQNQ